MLANSMTSTCTGKIVPVRSNRKDETWDEIEEKLTRSGNLEFRLYYYPRF